MKPSVTIPIVSGEKPFPGCRYCQGKGCLACQQERRRAEETGRERVKGELTRTI